MDPFEPTPEGLIASAKSVLGAVLGLKNAILLNENFIWIGPAFPRTAFSQNRFLGDWKILYNLQGAFPDLDFSGS